MSLVRRALLVLPLAGVALLAGPLPATVADELQTCDDATLLSQAHYAQVERELRSADTSDLTPAQRQRRERALAELAAYHREGATTFPRGATGDSCRLPYFRDAEGRHCGVANLMFRLGGSAFVDRVARTENHAYLSELADEPELIDWLDTHGLTLQEAVRIHAPVVNTPVGTVGNNSRVPQGAPEDFREDEPDEAPDDTPDGGGDGGDEPPTGGFDEGDGPDETPEGDADEDRPEDGGGDDGPDTGGDEPRGPISPPRPPRPDRPDNGRGMSAPTGGRWSGTPAWVLWWEFNKADYLRPNGLSLERGPVTPRADDVDSAEVEAARVRFHRERLTPALTKALAAKDAHVRAAAATALARTAGAAATQSIAKLLSDNQRAVREQAILALGVTGSDDATDILREIAQTGRFRRQKVSPSARPLAITALGLGQHYGIDDTARAEVASVLSKTKRKDLDDVGTAALLHHLLAPGAALGQASRSIAADRNAPVAVRARAVEQLSELGGRKTLTQLQKLLASRHVELRRSAAIALGEIDDPLALPRILTAFELEREPLTRGFLLVSIGRQGGKQARAFLVRHLLDGDRSQRPWAALALGVLARDGDDAFAREALRSAELPGESRGALWLALGISGDADATPRLTEALAGESSPWSRAYAALALGIVGGERSRFALLDRHESEKSDLVRTCIAQSLGSLGNEEDAPLLVSLLRGTSDPAMQASISVAIGFHGSHGALDGLLAAAQDGELPDTARAAAIDSIGLLLDRRPGFLLPTVYRRTNFDVMPRWMDVLFQTTL